MFWTMILHLWDDTRQNADKISPILQVNNVQIVFLSDGIDVSNRLMTAMTPTRKWCVTDFLINLKNELVSD